MANLMTEDEGKAFDALKRAFGECLHIQCRRRCPDNDGWEPKCDHCDIQHLFITMERAGLRAEEGGTIYGLRWLVEERHSQFDEEAR